MNDKLPGATPLALALAALLSSPALSSPAFAGPQSGADASASAAAAGQAPTTLETVKVKGVRPPEGYAPKRSTTATRTDTPLLDVPQAITVIGQQQLRDQAIQSMSDAVRYVPGIGITQGEGNRDGLVFRGNSSTADLFVDGMRDDVQYYRDTYNIERIEAFKGPNAMIFGRGSPGGLLNRVTKVADWNTVRAVGLQVGSFDKRRATVDVGQAINDGVAFRVTGVHEDSEGFRDGFELKRKGINPTLSLRPGEDTLVTLGVEYFRDQRTADRGIPSYQNPFNGTRFPLATQRSTFFGDPDASVSETEVNAFSALVEHDFGAGVLLRNRTRYADYDKRYQNVFPGSVNQATDTVALSAYHHATRRENLFNQTDLSFKTSTGAIAHTFLAGAEFGRQDTDNLRRTGAFASPAQAPCLTISANRLTCNVSLANPTVSVPVTYANSGSDANNTGVTRIAAAYVQDQIEFTPQWQAIVGVRFDRFDVDFTDLRASTPPASRNLASSDNLLSPRAGLVYKPVATVSLYTSYGITYLPRSGEQLGSLALNTQALDPEAFENLEVGAKWDIHPDLTANAALYRLDRSNAAVVDPANPAQMILLRGDSQRVEGVELSLAGQLTEAWQLIGSYAWQDARTTQAVDTTPAGRVLPQTPKHAIGLWSRVAVSANWGLGLGAIYRDRSFASISNAVTLKSYTRFDGAVYYRINDNLEAQLNLENLFDKGYFPSAHSDNNITPGAPRGAFVSLNLAF
jgi:catecholate siderophore receptor